MVTSAIDKSRSRWVKTLLWSVLALILIFSLALSIFLVTFDADKYGNQEQQKRNHATGSSLAVISVKTLKMIVAQYSFHFQVSPGRCLPGNLIGNWPASLKWKAYEIWIRAHRRDGGRRAMPYIYPTVNIAFAETRSLCVLGVSSVDF